MTGSIPPKETEAAQSLLNQGADVLLQNTDSAAVLQTAERAGKYAFGWDANMSHFGPKAHLASAVINWGPYYIKRPRMCWTALGHRSRLVGHEGRSH
jgi:basic membrane protein A